MMIIILLKESAFSVVIPVWHQRFKVASLPELVCFVFEASVCECVCVSYLMLCPAYH